MPSDDDLSRLILTAYDAAAGVAMWTPFLKRVTEMAKGSHAAILLNDYHRQHYNVAASYNIDPDAGRRYEAHYAAVDAYYLAGKHVLRTGWCGTSQMLIPDSKFLESEFYQDFQRHYDMFHMCLATAYFDADAIAGLTLLRSRRKGPFGSEQVKLLELLCPHLQAAFRLHRRMVELHAINQNLSQALELTTIAVLLVDRAGRILFASRSAESILRAQDGLRSRGNVLHADTSSESSALRAAIHVATNGEFAAAKSYGRPIGLTRKPPKPSLTLSVAPLRTAGSPLAPGQAVAAVFIFDPLEKPPHLFEVLRAVFALTPAEARLTTLLLSGRTLREAAETVGVTQNTVKTQMRSIFNKTNTSSQSHLARLLTSLVARLPVSASAKTG